MKSLVLLPSHVSSSPFERTFPRKRESHQCSVTEPPTEFRSPSALKVFRITTSLALKALVVALLASSLAAQPAPKEGDSGKVVERNIYIPYDFFDKVLENEQRGVFLPYPKVRAILDKLDELLQEGSEAPVQSRISQSSYTSQASDRFVRTVARYRVESLKAGWVPLSFSLSGLSLEKLSISDERAIPSIQGQQLTIFLPEAKSYEIELVFTFPVVERAATRSFTFRTPIIALADWTIEFDDPELEIQTSPGDLAFEFDRSGPGVTVKAAISKTPEITISWSAPAEELSPDRTKILAETITKATIKPKLLRIESSHRFQIEQGEAQRFRIEPPSRGELLSVTGENIRGWRTSEGGLTVDLHTPVTGRYELVLVWEAPAPEVGSLLLEAPSSQNVLRESGYLIVENEPSLRLEFGENANLIRIDRAEFPTGYQQSGGSGFRFWKPWDSLELTVQAVETQFRALSRSAVILGEEVDEWRGRIDLSVQEGGFFEIDLVYPSGWTVRRLGPDSVLESFNAISNETETRVRLSFNRKITEATRVDFILERTGTARGGALSFRPPRVPGALQDRGYFGVSVPRFIEATSTRTEGLKLAGPEESGVQELLGFLPTSSAKPRIYRFADEPTSLELNLELKATVIDVVAQHLIEVSDNYVDLTEWFDFRILFAETDRVRLSLGSDQDDVEISTPQKSEIQKRETADGRVEWEIRFQSPVLGSITVGVKRRVALEPSPAGTEQRLDLDLTRAEQVRASTGFVGLEKQASLELGATITDLDPVDAIELPDRLRRASIYKSFRYGGDSPALSLDVTRYNVSALVQLNIPLIYGKVVIADDLTCKTRQVFFIQNFSEAYLPLRLTPEIQVLSVSVAGRREILKQREDGTALVPLPTSIQGTGIFPVSIVYESRAEGDANTRFGRVELKTLEIGEPESGGRFPVSQQEWELWLHPKRSYYSFRGTLSERDRRQPLWRRLKSFLDLAARDLQPAERSKLPSYLPNPEGDPEVRVGGGFERVVLEGRVDRVEVSFRFIDTNLFWVLDALVVLLVLGLLFAVHRIRSSTVLPTAFLSVMVTLAVYLLVTPPWNQLGLSGILAVGLSLLLVGSIELRRLFEKRRERRIALAPDPFLEEAPMRRDSANREEQPQGDSEEEQAKESESHSDGEDKESHDKGN